MYLGKLIEFVPTSQVFKTPTHELTESHVSGRFGQNPAAPSRPGVLAGFAQN